jgi:glycosyltransferase involved in cell wall biosynthesis
MIPNAVELSVVIPAYREARSIGQAIEAVAAAVAGTAASFEIIVVDDGSPDETWSAIREAGARLSCVRGLRLSRNFGKEAAVFAGLAEACGRAVVVMDADLQHPPAVLPAFVAAWRRGAGEVIDGVKRDRREGAFWRRTLSALFNRGITSLTGFPFEGNSDYKLLDRRVVDAILQIGESRAFFRGLVAWSGFRHHRVEYDVGPSRHDGSRWKVSALVRLAAHAVLGFSAAPLRLIHVLWLFGLAGSIALAAGAAWTWWRGQAPRPEMLLSLLLITTGTAVLFSLGVIAEYLAAIYEEVKRRPRALVGERFPALPPAG